MLQFWIGVRKVARFGDLSVALLHTVGARSGEVRIVPLVVVADGEDRLVFGTKAGAKDHPDWALNLKAHPQITVELGTETFEAEVLELAQAEARKKVDTQAESNPHFAGYVSSAAPRAIPVFRIEQRS